MLAGITAYSILSAVLIGLGRVVTHAGHAVQPRYITITLYFWVAAFVFLVMLLRRAQIDMRRAAFVVLAVCLSLMFISHVEGMIDAFFMRHTLADAGRALVMDCAADGVLDNFDRNICGSCKSLRILSDLGLTFFAR
jgi:hypothetical protein